MINSVVIEGNVVRDAVLRSTAKGDSFMTLSLANEVWAGAADKSNAKQVNYVDVSMFGDRAEKLCELLTQGTRVIVEGRLKYSTWEKDGTKRSKHELRANDISFIRKRDDAMEEPEMAEEDFEI